MSDELLGSSNLYRDKTCWAPTVYAVDDAWFEGGLAEPPLLARLRLGGIHLQPRGLSLLKRKLDEQPGNLVSASTQYLSALVATCHRRGFHLRLCNFEWLGENWDKGKSEEEGEAKVNRKGNALLLDINYKNCPEGETPHDYGLRLIHRLLMGSRPQADVFIVTGWPDAYYDVIKRHISEASWWPVRGMPVVEKKAERLLSELGGFATYFQQGNQERPDVELLRSLVRAGSEGWGHPNDFDEVPGDLALRDAYQASEAAIKALYCDTQVNQHVPDYAIPCRVLGRLLNTSGIEFVDLPAGNVHLPLAPFGVLWVVKLWTLLRVLYDKRRDTVRATLRIDGRKVQINIPLDPSRVDLLHSAVQGNRRQGTTTRAYLDLAANRPTIATDLLDRMRDQEPRLLQERLKSVKSFELVTLGIEKGLDPALTIRWNGALR